MGQIYRAHLPLILISALLILLGMAYLLLHLVTPFDNGWLQPGVPSVTSQGLIVTPLEEGPRGFQPGDIVTAVEGRAIESWLRQPPLTGSHRLRLQSGEAATYTVLRQGQVREVSVTPGPYPLWAILRRNWGTFAFALLYLPIAAYVFLRRPEMPAARLLLLSAAALFSATTWSLGAQVSDFVDGIGFWLFYLTIIPVFMLVWIAGFHFSLVFPRTLGVLPRNGYFLAALYGLPYLLLAIYLFVTRQVAANNLGWISHWGKATDLSAAFFLSLSSVAVIWQYRSTTTQTSRRQMRWLGLATLAVGGSAVIFYFVPPLATLPSLDSNLIGLIGVLFPLSIAIAILRHNLFDIDTLLNRALVYGTLSFGVIALYLLVLTSVTLFFNQDSNLLISLLATGLAVVLIQPMRERLQGAVNRLMYGERDDPYAVLSGLGRQLESSVSPEATLPSAVETIARALKLPFVAIELVDENGFSPAASFGLAHNSANQHYKLPLVYQNAPVGRLILSPRSTGEAFTPAEQRLLEDIARHVGIAANAVQLTTHLQRSRQRIVNAREEERRRLRRDLHDGLGPQLASLTLRVDAARNLLERDPGAVDQMLEQIKVQTQAALGDIRRIAHNLRPPALDQLGLLLAIREHISTLNHPSASLEIYLQAPDELPNLPAAVEVAAYRVVLEALNNVIHHAQANRCYLRISVNKRLAHERLESECLELDICDNGRGLPDPTNFGVGLSSMRERAAELGGTCTVSSRPEGGTQVSLRLPLNNGSNHLPQGELL
ncbi:MAG: histidine kinase [Anaerolineales bacterium]